MGKLTLFRNISIDEFVRLAVDEKVAGKIHTENKDSTYTQDVGAVVFFFEHPCWLPRWCGFDLMIEVEVDTTEVVGDGVATYETNYDDTYNIPAYIIQRREVYLREYRLSDVKAIYSQGDYFRIFREYFDYEYNAEVCECELYHGGYIDYFYRRVLDPVEDDKEWYAKAVTLFSSVNNLEKGLEKALELAKQIDTECHSDTENTAYYIRFMRKFGNFHEKIANNKEYDFPFVSHVGGSLSHAKK